MYRQGDILLTKQDKVPEGLVQVPAQGGRYVLAYGEVTGHAHAVYDTPNATLFMDKGGDVADVQNPPTLYLVVNSPTALRHEEHAPISLDGGVYKVDRQREYTPEGIKRVLD